MLKNALFLFALFINIPQLSLAGSVDAHEIFKEKKPIEKKYHFSTDWFSAHIPNWEKTLTPLKDQKINVLEIGAFEGASTTWILDNLLQNPESKIITIDSFEGGIEHQDTSSDWNKPLSTLEETFLSNIEKTGRMKQLELIKSYSYPALIRLNAEKKHEFDFIYVDASHMARDVLGDAVLAWPMLKEGGIMIFDDYNWNYYQEDYANPKLAIDSFLACFNMDIEIISKDYQLVIKKVIGKNKITLTKVKKD